MAALLGFAGIFWLVAAGPAAFAAEIAPIENAPSVDAIIERAIETDRLARQNLIETRYRFRHVNVTEKLDGENTVKRTERHVYSVYPRDGEAYYELVETLGRKATAKDRVKEDEVRRRFRQEINSDPNFKESGSRGFALTPELVSRYTADLLGVQPIDGRPSYVLAFRPKSGKLPVRRRIDRALNKASGRLWIDVEDYGLSQIEFSLIHPVKVWGGLLATIKQLEGRIRLTRLGKGAWHPESMQLRMDGRMLFRSLNRRISLAWSGFEPVADGE